MSVNLQAIFYKNYTLRKTGFLKRWYCQTFAATPSAFLHNVLVQFLNGRTKSAAWEFSWQCDVQERHKAVNQHDVGKQCKWEDFCETSASLFQWKWISCAGHLAHSFKTIRLFVGNKPEFISLAGNTLIKCGLKRKAYQQEHC